MEGMTSLDREQVCTNALNPRPHGYEEASEVLHVGLTRGVAKNRDALRCHRGGQSVLRSGNARLVEEDVGATELLRAEPIRLAQIEVGPELLKGEKVGIETSSANDVPAGRWQRHLPAAREHRRC